MYYLIFLLLITIVTLIFVCSNINIRNDKRYLKVIFIIITLFLGIRGVSVGLDMGNYNEFFNIVQTSSIKYLTNHLGFEFGFKLFTKLITLFTDNFRIFIFIISTLSTFGIYNFIKNNSKNYFASIFIFITFNYYIYLFCTLRQALAISILLISFKYLKENKFIKFILLVLMATMFHKTAIIFSVLYFVKKIPLKKIYIILYLIGCSLLFVFRKQIVYLATVLLYNQYIDYRDMSGSGYAMLIFLLIIAIGISIYYFKKQDRFDKSDNILIFMTLLTIPFQILSTTQGLIARLVLYFSYGLIIIIPNILEKMDEKYKFKLECAYYILLTLFFVIEVFTNAMYVPYVLN